MDEANLDELLETEVELEQAEFVDFDRPIKVELVKEGSNVTEKEKNRLLVDKQVKKMEVEIQHLGDYASKNHIKAFVFILEIIEICFLLVFFCGTLYGIFCGAKFLGDLISNIIQMGN